jgi:DNA-binding NtrC family response regulator
MKVLVLDDEHETDTSAVRDAFSRKKIDAVVCKSSNDFLTALNSPKFDAAYINADSWARGRTIYDYFDAGRRLESKKIIIYNADEVIAPIKNRAHIEGDAIHRKPFDIEAVIDTL